MLLYLHIPFCDSKCSYCSFNSYTNMQHYYKNYMHSLRVSLEKKLEPINHLDTVFIGGGTPSTIFFKDYEDIFNILKPYINTSTEITTEANPNSATKEWLKEMFNLGVNRVSFGVQSFNDKKLKILNRAHSSKEAIKAIENAYSVGFKNISLDIIYDLYIDTKELILNDLELAFKLPINHISSYELTIEKATAFTKMPEVKKDSSELGFFLRDYIVSRGFEQYEVSNYGTYKSRHNLGYWQHKEYLGIGAGAVGFIKNRRLYPHTNIEKFIKEPHFNKIEELSKDDILTEKIFLGLRSIVGIKKEILPKNMQQNADILVDEKKLELRDNTYYNKEFFLSDELALFILG